MGDGRGGGRKGGTPMAGKEASLTFRLALRAIQPRRMANRVFSGICDAEGEEERDWVS